MKSRWFIFTQIVFILVFNSQCHNDSDIDKTMDYFNSRRKEFILSEEPNVVIFIGVSGVGKSTIVHSLIDPSKIKSKYTNQQYELIDSMRSTVRNETSTKSDTLIPEVHPRPNDVWYDCPGFSDNRNVSVNMLNAYTIKTVAEKAKNLKIVFVINRDAVKRGEGHRNGLDQALDLGVQLLKNVDKYKSNIALIVNRCEYETITPKKVVERIDKSIIIEEIVEFLNTKKTELILSTKYEDKSAILLLDAWLTQNDGYFSRIGLFYSLVNVGKFNEIPEMIEARSDILQIIDKNIQFKETETNDFGYNLSPWAKKELFIYSKRLSTYIKAESHGMIDQIVKKITDNEKAIRNLQKRQEYTKNVHLKLKSIFVFETVKTFTPEFINFLHEFSASVEIENCIRKINESLSFSNIMKEVYSDVGTLPVNELNDLFDLMRDLLEGKYNWNSFLISVHKWLSSYKVQRNRTKLDIKKVHNEIEFISFEKKLEENPFGIQSIKSRNMSFVELNEIIDQTIFSKPKITCVNGTAIFRGEFILLDKIDLTTVKCVDSDSISRVHVYALNKFFVDKPKSDVYRGLKEFVVIANVWEIIHGTELDLRGQTVENMSHENIDGNFAHPNGIPGQPGETGSNGANFFGYANEIVSSEIGMKFKIDISGINGGRGQDGSRAYPEKPIFKVPLEKFKRRINPLQELRKHSNETMGNFIILEANRTQSEIDHVFWSIVACELEELKMHYSLYARQCCKPDGLAGAGELHFPILFSSCQNRTYNLIYTGGYGGYHGDFSIIIPDDAIQIEAINGAVGDNGTNVEPCQTEKMNVEYIMGCEPFSLFGSAMLGKFSGEFRLKDVSNDERCRRESKYTKYNENGRVKPKTPDKLNITLFIDEFLKMLQVEMDSLDKKYSILLENYENIYQKVSENEKIENLLRN